MTDFIDQYAADRGTPPPAPSNGSYPSVHESAAQQLQIGYTPPEATVAQAGPVDDWRDYRAGSLNPDDVSDAQLTALAQAMLTNPLEYNPLPNGGRRAANVPLTALPPEWQDEAKQKIYALPANASAADRQRVIDATMQKFVTASSYAAGPKEGMSQLHATMAAHIQEANRMNDELEALGKRRDELKGYDPKGRPIYVLDELSRARVNAEINAKIARARSYELDAGRRFKAAIRDDYTAYRATAERQELEAEAQQVARRLKVEERAREIARTLR